MYLKIKKILILSVSIIGNFFIINFSYGLDNIYRFYPSNLGIEIHQNQNIKISRENFDEFIRYNIFYNGEQITLESGGKQYGDLKYIIGENSKVFSVPNMKGIDFSKWEVNNDKSSVVSTFTTRDGYNVYIGYTMNNERLCIGMKFIKSLFEVEDAHIFENNYGSSKESNSVK